MNNELAVVTGAGGGLGRALSRELAGQGLVVAGIGRDAKALTETGKSCDGRFHPVIADLADPGEVARAFSEIDRIGQMSILVNNAAVYPRRDILDETPDSFAATLATNLGGVVASTHEALTRMVKTGRGRIVNVASMADIAPLSGSAAYSVSKGAARIYTRALVADLNDRFPGIVISDWLPGMLSTRMGVSEGLAPEDAARWGARLATWHDQSLNGTVWEMNRELLPARGLKGRIKDRLLGRKRIARILD